MAATRKNWPTGQCPVCLSWGELRQYTVCPACAKWRRAFPGQKNCRRCGHINHVSPEGLCRPCLQTVRLDDPGWVFNPVPGRPVQLGFLLPGVRLPKAAPLLLPAQRKGQLTAQETLDEVIPTPAKWTWLAQRPPAQPVSPHLVDPAQLSLFETRRDWSCLAVGTLDQLPSLTPAAQALAEEFQQHARAHGWNASPRNAGARTLRILLAWVGADAPIHEADIRALSQRRSTTIRRMLQFLGERGMVIPDPARQGTAAERAVQQRIQTLPSGIASELRRWVQVARGQGRREHQELPFTTIRSYLNCLRPVLAAWAAHVTSLREITRDDIQAALEERPGVTAHNLLPALRSLFRALKQERIIFQDPTRGISLPAMRRLPIPIPTDQLHGLIGRADSPMAKLIVALIAIHGLGKKETSHLLLADLDLPSGRILARRAAQQHTVYLGELTHTLAIDWLRERHRRWPLTTNPHLLVSQVTAADATLPPIAHTVMDAIFQPLGLSPSKLRQDRILDEAKHTADPVHLMRVFGLTAKPAMYYVQAAHPERRSTLPR
jgi:Phage integrase, N-terminal SAM-like domain